MLTRSDVRAKITAHLAGQITAAQLAAWAFARFYALEQATETCDPEDEAMLMEILDDLMFGDDPTFRLDGVALRTLLAQLERS